jgi:hypothetical protein
VELAAVDDARGEFTVVAAPPARPDADPNSSDAPADEQLDRLVRALLDDGVTAKTLAHALATLPGVSHKEAYARVLAIADRR